MGQSVFNVSDGYGVAVASGGSREIQSFRGIMIGVGLSAILWAPLGLIALRIL